MPTLTKPELTVCLRCGYQWPKRKQKPKACPSCHSYKWDIPRPADSVISR